MPDRLRDGLTRLCQARGKSGTALSVLAGAGLGLGQAPFSLIWLALPALALALGRGMWAPSTRQAALQGWFVGVAYAAVTLFWIVEPFLVDIQRHGWMAPFALALMAGGFGLFWGAGFWLAAKMAPLGGWRPLALPLAWTAVEILRAYAFSGFPWALVSYIWIGTPVYQLAAVFGPHGLTLATFLVFAGLTYGVLHQRPALATLGFAGLLVLFPAGLALRPVLPPVADDRPVIRLIQPNADQREKWDPQMIPVFYNRQLDYTGRPANPEPDLIIWPEVAVPFLLNDPTAPLLEIAGAAGSASVVLGGQRVEEGKGYNSLALLGPDGAPAQIYDKRHLVPFGEYIPGVSLMKGLGLRALAAQAGNGYTPGRAPARMQLGDLGVVLPMICYEAIFPHELRRGEGRPSWLLLITNDAWFGKFSGPYQHLAQARARSIETGLPMVRVANTGISGLIDATGNLGPSLPLGKAGYIDVRLPEPSAATLYWRFGDWPVLVLLILSSAALFVLARRNTD